MTKDLKKTEIVVFNKSDLIDMNSINEKLKNFKKELRKVLKLHH